MRSSYDAVVIGSGFGGAVAGCRLAQAGLNVAILERGRLGREAQFCYPNIAVDFSTPGVAHRNKFGVEQSGCTYCGECDIGCNVLAKNTLDLNYLAIAEHRGAYVAPLCEVVRIEHDGA